MTKTDSELVMSWRPPLGSLMVLDDVFVAGLFVVGYDQGHTFGPVRGSAAFGEMFLHEFTYDMSMRPASPVTKV